MDLGYYTLDEAHGLVPATLLEWAAMFDDISKRRVGYDIVDGVTVSTVFLGTDHGFGGHREFFETMTFGGAYDQLLIGRCATWDEAVEGHRVTVNRLRAGYHPAR